MPNMKRILLKLSGEALGGQSGCGIDDGVLQRICKAIGECVDAGVQVAVVVGGGNYFRGRTNPHMNRCRADQIGMLATVMNALSLGDGLEQQGIPSVVMTAVSMQPVAQYYNYRDATTALEEGKVVILGGGTGSPFFSTDTGAALRAAELGVDVILKASTIDGIYDKDPKVHKDAVKFDEMSFQEVLEKRLGVVVDTTAAALCMENKIPLYVFLMDDPENILRAVQGEKIGTIVKEEHWS